MAKIAKLALLSAFLAANVPAFAQQGGTADQRAACTPDVRKFCKSIPKGSDDSMYYNCLQANRAKVSDKCRRVMDGG
jgi:hypothetical protein